MGTTYLHAVASLDGYIADERDDVVPAPRLVFQRRPFCNQTVRFAMYLVSRVCVRRLDVAEDLSLALIHPVPQVVQRPDRRAMVSALQRCQVRGDRQRIGRQRLKIMLSAQA
jgi:hypothetical protein